MHTDWFFFSAMVGAGDFVIDEGFLLFCFVFFACFTLLLHQAVVIAETHDWSRVQKK